MHWPTDAIASAALGIAVGWLGTLPRLLAAMARPAFALLDAQPGLFYAAFFLITFQTAGIFVEAREPASFWFHTLARLM
jgi:membrane-associated phospholipid phosphatase